jgi:hypothetical protein
MANKIKVKTITVEVETEVNNNVIKSAVKTLLVANNVAKRVRSVHVNENQSAGASDE